MSRFSILAAVVALVAAACASTGADTAQDAATTTAAPVTTTAPAPETTVTTEAETGHDEEGEAGHDDDSSDADRMVEIIMTEFSFDVNPLAVTAGETIEFVVTNAGVVEHEFRLSNAHRIEEHLASGHDDHDDSDGESDDGGHHEGDADVVLLLDAGDTGTVVVTFPEDTTLFTEVACLLPGHYEAGMAADIEYAT